MTGPGVEERLGALREAGRELAARPAAELAAVLAEACGRWADPRDPDRAAAAVELAARHGVPRESIATVLDAAFPRWTLEALREWVRSELGGFEALDGWVERSGARRRAFGPTLVHVLAAHGVPTTPVADVLAALLVKAPVWLKPARGADDLARPFFATLAAIDPGLGAAVEVSGWPRGDPAGAAVAAAAEVLVVTGGAEAVEAARRLAGPATRVVMHGPRLSAAAIAREALAGDEAATIAALADDVAHAGQAGCLSPVVAWIEASPADVDRLVAPLHAACRARWPGPPRRATPNRERATWAERSALAGVEAAMGAGGAWIGGPDDAWTVHSRRPARPPEPPPVPRFVVLEPVEDLARAVELCAARRGLVAAVGVAASEERVADLAIDLGAAGVERVAPIGCLQRPPLAWRRDGRPTLADLVRWVDLEALSL